MKALVAMLLSGCLWGCLVEVDYTGTRFLCRSDSCPEGFDCRSGTCVESGTPLDASAADGALDASADAAPAICAGGCTPVTGADACFCAAEMSWAEARDACIALGSSLARLRDARSQAAVRAEVTAQGLDVRAWLGGTDAAAEGEWRWLVEDDLFWTGLADGSAPPGVPTDFALDEPNQFMGNDEDCLQVWDVGWNDARCLETRPSLCDGL